MKRKLIKRYILICFPFICGLLLYGIGYYGVISSLLFFCGGYILFKNIFDYRVVKKNIRKCIDKNNNLEIDNDDRDIDDVMELDLDRDKIDRVNVIEQNYNNSIDIRKENECDCMNKYGYEYMKRDNINGLKSTRRYIKIRRRY